LRRESQIPLRETSSGGKIIEKKKNGYRIKFLAPNVGRYINDDIRRTVIQLKHIMTQILVGVWRGDVEWLWKPTGKHII
jgi:hypothetical protein